MRTEKNYSTIEGELLTVVDGVKKSYFYLYGDEFVLQIDHMPLVSVYLKECKLQNTEVLLCIYSSHQSECNIFVDDKNVRADISTSE